MENFETFAIRTQTERTQFDEHSTPLYLTSSFIFQDAEDIVISPSLGIFKSRVFY
ncbi:MAG: hypothetical protein WCJ72_17425 [Chryseobacterium sp.]